MKLGVLLYFLGGFLLFFSVALLLPLLIALWYHESIWWVFPVSAAVSASLGAILIFSIKSEEDLGYREGFAVVAFSWILAGAIGALPYILSGVLSPVDALFESVSGFTTTGSTVFEKLENLPRGLLFWRSLSQWLGGMGIIVLSLAILPFLGIGGAQLYQAEVPGLVKDRLTPRIQDTARILWSVYVLFTLVETLLLLLGGLSPYEAISHAFTTMATGGFSTRTASIGAFDSAYIDYVVTFFMFLAGTNFALHYRALKGDLKVYLQDEEFRFYFMVTLLATLLCLIFTLPKYGLISAFRYGTFQVVSIMTTTGYGTADYDAWPQILRLMMVILMCFGGMAGSTGGGVKQVRMLLFFRFIKIQFRKLLHPRAVETLKYQGERVPQEVIQSLFGFLALYLLIFLAASFIVCAQGVDLETGVSAVAATLNNIGPGLAKVGPTQNFAHLPDLSKLVLTFCMLAGRLELFPMMIILTRSYWKDVKGPNFRF
ncbi:TrkH family potassium uptake protein [Thermosulfurimonas dismutans]|uniref:Potassium uptake protein TrkH n=1 Tax=Thermosulfurimonas dismutans TaxID=999894 RepID=A0A179D735_9BACT|nr:potassium transporter TrkG [Thermosulfurimonas dismutans]OAQ21783.1 Potassium uptake protein TrkH [Thermosulfurimonas dismutans]